MANIDASELSSTDSNRSESTSSAAKRVWQTPDMDKLKVQKTEAITPNVSGSDGGNGYS